MTPNKQLQRTVIPNRWRAARAPFHYARASRWTRGRAAAELRRLGALLTFVPSFPRIQRGLQGEVMGKLTIHVAVFCLLGFTSVVSFM